MDLNQKTNENSEEIQNISDIDSSDASIVNQGISNDVPNIQFKSKKINENFAKNNSKILRKSNSLTTDNQISDSLNRKIGDQLNKNPKLKKQAKGISNSTRKNDTNRTFINKNQQATENEKSDFESVDIFGKIKDFIKKNPGILVSVVFVLICCFIVVIILLFVVAAIMTTVQSISEFLGAFANGWSNFWESVTNGLTFRGFKTNENVYYDTVKGEIDRYGERLDSVTKEKIPYYVDAATFYSSIPNPEALNDVKVPYGKDDDGNTYVEGESNNFVNQTIGTEEQFRQKFAAIKDHPKDLINNLISCPDDEALACSFDEAKYKNYLIQYYVKSNYINCKECGYNSATEEQKQQASRNMAEEIISQAKTFYKSDNAADTSNYTVYNALVSGITVKDSEGDIVGTYSLSEYVKTIVERDASVYDDEIKKAYALVVISNLLTNISNNEIVDDNFSMVTISSTTSSSVDSVIDLKMTLDEKVYSAPFDFDKAQQVIENGATTYEEIIRNMYGQEIKIEESVSNGLQLDPETGFYMRVQPPSKNDTLYYGSGGYIGECAWYTTRRAIEITRTLGVTEWQGNSNGNSFCYLAAASNYNTCWPSRGESCVPKQGAIISWDYTSGPYNDYGHVAIIEKVNSNSVTYSDSALMRGSYGKIGTYSEVSNYLASIDNGRYKNCTAEGYSCIIANNTSTISGLSTGNNGRHIVCYIYLTEPN